VFEYLTAIVGIADFIPKWLLELPKSQVENEIERVVTELNKDKILPFEKLTSTM
jgi:hypothetical protein